MIKQRGNRFEDGIAIQRIVLEFDQEGHRSSVTDTVFFIGLPCGELSKRRSAAASLPEGSEVTVIPGGSHVVYIEKPNYRAFQNALVSFLGE